MTTGMDLGRGGGEDLLDLDPALEYSSTEVFVREGNRDENDDYTSVVRQERVQGRDLANYSVTDVRVKDLNGERARKYTKPVDPKEGISKRRVLGAATYDPRVEGIKTPKPDHEAMGHYTTRNKRAPRKG